MANWWSWPKSTSATVPVGVSTTTAGKVAISKAVAATLRGSRRMVPAPPHSVTFSRSASSGTSVSSTLTANCFTGATVAAEPVANASTALTTCGIDRRQAAQPVWKNSSTTAEPLRLSLDTVVPSRAASTNGVAALPTRALGGWGVGGGSSRSTRDAPAGTSNTKASDGTEAGNVAPRKSTTTDSPPTGPPCCVRNCP